MSKLLELAERAEKAAARDRALNREVALAVGWHRYSPSEIGKSNPGWIAPEDYIGDYVGKDGRRSPKLDSLHGTTIWREPRDYLGSLDAAMTLVPEGWRFAVTDLRGGDVEAWDESASSAVVGVPSDEARADAATPALALCAAALRARASQEQSA